MEALINLFVAYAPLVNTLATAIVGYMLIRLQNRSKAIDTNVKKLEQNTNGITEKLIATTERAAHAEGKVAGIAEEVAKQAVKDAAVVAAVPVVVQVAAPEHPKETKVSGS